MTPSMRIFSVGSGGGFTEYERLPFEVEHEESVLEKWLESNPDGILEDGRILIIGRQIRTDLGGFIDLVGVDREGNAVVVELKRDRTPRDVIAQALEYAAFAERLDADALARGHLPCVPLGGVAQSRGPAPGVLQARRGGRRRVQ